MMLSLKNLLRSPRRTIAILLTIAFGAGALFAFQGFIKGVLGDYKHSTIHSHYGHGQINRLHYRDKVHKEPWKEWMTEAGEIESFLKNQEGVSAVFPRVSFQALLKHGKNSAAGLGQGIEARKEAKFFNSLNVEKGENLSWQEDGILLGKGLADALGAAIGDKIILYTENVKGKSAKDEFKVTGIFHTGIVDFDSRVFRIQLAKGKKLLKSERIETFSIALADESVWPHLVKAVAKAFPFLEATYFDELDKVYYKNSVEWLNAQYTIVQLIILSIVMLGIFNSISSAILERKQEIGNLRANGESRASIIRLVMTEGALLGLGGAFIGISLVYVVFSYCLGEGILMPPGPGSTRAFIAKFTFTYQEMALTGALSFFSAELASFFAVLRVIKIPIAKALRSY